MKTLKDIKKSSASQLMLGTVQFGLNYGIANTQGKPLYETSRDIVRCAYEGGVDCLDTAAAYGDSEEVVGKILDDLNIRDEILVVTKVPALPDTLSSSQIANWVQENLDRSCSRLGTDVLQAVLLHREADFEKAFEYLENAQKKGQILAAGISGGSSAEITSQAIASGKMQALQVPSNIYDRRFRKAGGVIESAAAQDMAVFTRSAYLQGLAVMPIEKIAANPYFAEFLPVRQEIEKIATQAGLTLCKLSIRYILSLKGITRLLVGVDNPQQMQDNLNIAASGSLSNDLIEAIDNCVPELPEKIINPVHWPK